MTTEFRHPALRFALGVAAPVMLLAAPLLPLWLLRTRLPEPMATHWDLYGIANGAMRQQYFGVIMLVMCGMAAAGMFAVTQRRHAARGAIAGPLAVTGFIAGLGAAISWLTVWANLDAADWHTGHHLSVMGAGLALVAGGTLAAALARLGTRLETATDVVAEVPRAGLAPGVRAVWVGYARSSWAMPLVIIGIVLTAVVVRFSVMVALVFALTSLVGVFFTSIRMTADRNGVRIAYGLLGWPVQRIRLQDIRVASSLKLDPMSWGGWGYRGSLRVARRAAVVLRGGEGVKLELSGDRVLAITIDGADEAAGVINDLVSAGTGH